MIFATQNAAFSSDTEKTEKHGQRHVVLQGRGLDGVRQYRNEEVLPTEYCPSTNTLGLASKSLVVSGFDCHSPKVSCNERPMHHSTYATTSRSVAVSAATAPSMYQKQHQAINAPPTTAPSMYHTAASSYQCTTNHHTGYVSPRQHEATKVIMHAPPNTPS